MRPLKLLLMGKASKSQIAKEILYEKRWSINNEKKYLLISLLSIGLDLDRLSSVENWFKMPKEEWIGLEMTVRTMMKILNSLTKCQEVPIHLA